MPYESNKTKIEIQIRFFNKNVYQHRKTKNENQTPFLQ